MAKWWDNVMDFAYRHAPERVQGWLDDKAAVYRISPERADTSEREHGLSLLDNAKQWPHWEAKTPQDMMREGDLMIEPRTVSRPLTWKDEYELGTGMTESRDDEILRRYSDAIRRPGAVDAPAPVIKPTESVAYIEEHRYHDKHHGSPKRVYEVRGPDSRQQGWTWDR